MKFCRHNYDTVGRHYRSTNTSEDVVPTAAAAAGTTTTCWSLHEMPQPHGPVYLSNLQNITDQWRRSIMK
jgi:hypothetical protein